MRRLGFAIVIVVLGPSHVLAQDYINATNAAWCAGALGAYALPSESRANYLVDARSRHLASAQGFFSTSGDNGATMLIFEKLGSMGATACNQACASQQKGEARTACFDTSRDCKRIIDCLTN
jgi:hypothetical protein